MTISPASIEELRQAVAAHPRVSLRGGGTKTGLSSPVSPSPVAQGFSTALVDLSRLSGIVAHTPEECTFTALAGTRIDEIERVLAPHGQYLPFDPPLSAAGATIGGTVAAGLNGSCRYRYGGIRDFLIGARIVDGRPSVPQPGPNTQYAQLRWGDPRDLVPAARQGSLCSRVLLRARDLEWDA